MLIAVALEATSAPFLPRDVWASVSSSASLAHTSTTVAFLRPTSRTAPLILRLTSSKLDEAPVVMWATSQTCPGIQDAVRRLQAIPMPAVELPGDMGDIVLDGNGYRVRVFARYGNETGLPLDLSSNQGTPLADWVNKTFALLQPCWSEARPD